MHLYKNHCSQTHYTFWETYSGMGQNLSGELYLWFCVFMFVIYLPMFMKVHICTCQSQWVCISILCTLGWDNSPTHLSVAVHLCTPVCRVHLCTPVCSSAPVHTCLGHNECEYLCHSIRVDRYSLLLQTPHTTPVCDRLRLQTCLWCYTGVHLSGFQCQWSSREDCWPEPVLTEHRVFLWGGALPDPAAWRLDPSTFAPFMFPCQLRKKDPMCLSPTVPWPISVGFLPFCQLRRIPVILVLHVFLLLCACLISAHNFMLWSSWIQMYRKSMTWLW